MWIAWALICALSLAASDALTKAAHNRAGSGVDLAMPWLRVAMCAPLGIIALAFIETPPLDRTFWITFAAAMPFEMAALYLYTRALRESPLSLTVPFLAITPVLVIATGKWLVGESVSAAGASGIALVALGGYVLNIGAVRVGGLWAPIRAIGRERGSLMMLGTATIFSITAALLKVGINHSSPMFYGAVYYIALALCFFPIAAGQLRRIANPRAVLPLMGIAGALQFVMLMTNMIAVSMAPVAYMVAVKRTSLLFGVLFGFLFFKEGSVVERSSGALLMFAGLVVIVIFGHGL